MSSKRPRSGFFQNDPYKDLLEAMRSDNENKFNQILTSENINVNKVYDSPPDIGTILDLCCIEGNRSKYIATLLSRGANPNLINSRTKKGPIHQLALKEDALSMQILVDFEETDPNLLDNFGSTALHYAVKNNSRLMVDTILTNADANPNIINRKGKAPLHIVLDKEPAEEYLPVLRVLIEHPRIDLSLTDPDGATLRELIEDAYPLLRNFLPPETVNTAGADSGQLFQMLRRNNYQQFLSQVKGNKAVLDAHDGQYTLLQYCCDYGIEDAVEALLDEGVDPNGTCTNNIYPPLMIACRKGYINIVKMLVNSKKISYQPVNSQTVLHCLVNGGYETDALGGEANANIEIDHLKCLTYILKKVPPGTIDLNFRDKSGNTALHYAAKMGDQNLVLEILAAGAYIGICNRLNEPACADIARITMERHLNNSIYTNEKMPRDETYAIVFDYSCLVPFNKTEQGAKPAASSSDHFIEVPDSQYGGSALYRTGETDPLIYISRNIELRPLLTHPIFTSYLHLKWCKLQPYYFINLIFYLIFWLTLTYYILWVFVDSPTTINTNSTAPLDQEFTGDSSHFVAWCLGFLLLLVLVREVTQFVISPLKYIANPENWLEIGIIIVTSLILTCGGCSDIKHPIAAIAILASWAELVLLIGKHPALSTNIEMLKTVSWTFFKFLAWYSILIVAFALCFFTLFKDGTEDDNQFQRPFISIFKTIVMLTGEFDSGSIPFLLYPVTSHILFVLFVFLIAIVLFNLLNGLAVNDTQAIKAEAELYGFISQAKLISQIEDKVTKRFDCCGLFRRSFNFSDSINMFKDITDGKIKVYPNNWNRVELDHVGLGKKRTRRESDHKCYEPKSIYMDARIVKSAREILSNRDLEMNHQSARLRANEEALPSELRNILREFRDCLEQFKAINANARMGQQSHQSRY